MPIYHELKLTDGTTVINLLNLPDGYSVAGHRQAIAQYKGGGSWSQSALGDGAQLAYYAYDDAMEAYPITAVATGDPAPTIAALTDLLALLRKCSDYWVDDYKYEPVWVQCRAYGEPNTRYAIIKAGTIPDLGNPYEEPWISSAALEGLELSVRRGHWRDVVPQTGTALPLGVRKYFTGHGPKGNIIGATGLLEETTANEMFVSNTATEANLTDIYQYTAIGPVWSANRELDSAFTITGAAANDAMYFGVEDLAGQRKGPDNLVFDIGTENTNLTYAWEYYSSVGPGWVAFTQYADTTDVTPTTLGGSFTELGVNSIVFPTSDNWIPCNLFTLFAGVAPNLSCYYLRCRVSAVGGAPVGPVQQNRPVYQCIWPYIEVQADRVQGQIPQILKATVFSRSGTATVYPTAGDYKLARVVGGLRSVSRGATFFSRFNIGGEENPPFTSTGPTATTTLESYPARTVGRFNPGGVVAYARQANILLGFLTTTGDFNGRYRVFVRYNLSTGASGDVNVYLTQTSSTTTIKTSETFTAEIGEARMWDFGEFTVPGILPMEEYEGYTYFDLYAECTNAGGADLTLFDLCLIPSDEFIFDVNVSVDGLPLYYPEYAEIDSLTDAKRIARTIGIAELPIVSLKSVWTSIMGDRLQFEPTGGLQRLHLLFADFDNDIEIVSPHLLTSFNMLAANQYLGLRTE